MRSTRKLYHQNPSADCCQARVVKVHERGLELDQTVAFAEGGGQESDHGRIVLSRDPSVVLSFTSVQLTMAELLHLDNFPTCKTGGVIVHETDQSELLALFQEGDEVEVQIDMARRQALSRYHSAAHMLYWAIEERHPEVAHHTIGCHITPESGRFDFATEQRFSAEDIAALEARSNELIAQDAAISVYGREDYPDARYWECAGHIIPCGGTHARHCHELRPITVKRKNIGKGKERLMFTWAA